MKSSLIKLILLSSLIFLSGCANMSIIGIIPYCEHQNSDPKYVNDIKVNPIVCGRRVGLGFRIEF